MGFFWTYVLFSSGFLQKKNAEISKKDKCIGTNNYIFWTGIYALKFEVKEMFLIPCLTA